MNLDIFFKEKGIDQYSVAQVGSFGETAKRKIADYYPGSHTTIVFAKEIPRECFSLGPKVQMTFLVKLQTSLEDCAFDLSEKLIRQGFFSVPVCASGPLKIESGRLMGFLSLKHLAAECGLGGIGLNTILINRKYGNRILLSAVLTGKQFEPFNCGKVHFCTNCGNCISACPGNAFEGNIVRVEKCLNVKLNLPPFARPLLRPILKSRVLKKYAELMINSIGAGGELACLKCLSSCPFFNN
jgi:epoxyqueuosine reductase